MVGKQTSRDAIRRRSRKPRRRRSTTPMVLAIAAVVLVFGFGIFAAVRQREADAKTAPKANQDHWHAYLGVNVCGTWSDSAPKFDKYANKNSPNEPGIHSHGDGLVHIHPFLKEEAGKNATLGKFFTFGGWSLSDSSMELWDGVTHKNGQECPAGSNYGALYAAASTTTTTAPGSEPTTTAPDASTTTSSTVPSGAQPAYIVWTVNGKPMRGNPASYRPKNGDIIAIGFLPKGVPLPEPPNAKEALTNISDLPGGGQAQPQTPVAPIAPVEPTPVSVP